MFQEQIKQFFISFMEEGWRILTEDIVNTMIRALPDFMGYVTIACGGYMIIAPMMNKSISRPMGLFAVSGIAAVSILGVN